MSVLELESKRRPAHAVEVDVPIVIIGRDQGRGCEVGVVEVGARKFDAFTLQLAACAGENRAARATVR